MKHTRWTRREFLAASGAAAFCVAAPGAQALHSATPPRIAVVGCGTRGMRHLRQLGALQAPVAVVCDIADEAIGHAAAVSGAAPVRDWQALLEADDIHAAVLASPDALHGTMVESFLEAGKHVFCASPWGGVTLLPGQRQDVCLGASMGNPYGLAWRSLQEIAQASSLGRLRWSQVHLGPLRQPTRESWIRHYAEGIFPLLALSPQDRPASVAVVGTGHSLPHTFSSEIRMDSGHTLLVQCTAANPVAQHPVARGERATLEMQGRKLLLYPEHGQEAPMELEAQPLVSPLQDWLAQVRSGRPDHRFINTLMACESVAARALDAYRSA